MTEDPSVAKRRRQVRQWYANLANDIPAEFTILEAVVSFKCLDDEGTVCLVHQRTDGLSAWEGIGMLVSAQDDIRAALQTPIEDDD